MKNSTTLKQKKEDSIYYKKLEEKKKEILSNILDKNLPAAALIQHCYYSNKKIEKLDIYLATTESLDINNYFLTLNNVLTRDFYNILQNKKSKIEGGLFSRRKYNINNQACKKLFKNYNIGIDDRTPEGIIKNMTKITKSWRNNYKESSNSYRGARGDSFIGGLWIK